MFLNKYYPFIFILFATLVLSSCIGNKKVVYFQEKTEVKIADSLLHPYNMEEYRIQKNDILEVKVYSTEKEADDLFNTNSGSALRRMGGGGQMMGAMDIFFFTGYTISDLGYIDLPVAGSVYVYNKTLTEAKKTISDSLSRYFNSLRLDVRIGGVRFTTLGEFNSPGKNLALQKQLTIFEAIAMSGDFTILAKRDKIKLLRQYPEGSKLFEVDLLDKNIINSPYYFIQPNDLIYAEPLKRRVLGFGTNALQTLTAVTSVLTTTLLLINLFQR